MYKLKNIAFKTEKLEISSNNIKPGNFKLIPKITRRTGKINDKLFFTNLVLELTSSEEVPFPVNMFIDFRGIFEMESYDHISEIDEFLKGEAVKIMFPYLRTMVTNLSTAGLFPPIVLPHVDVDKLFKPNTDSIHIN